MAAPVLRVEPIDAPSPALDYARVTATGLDPAAHAALRRFATLAVWLAILSGLCVGVCFLTLSGGIRDTLRNVIHFGVFATTLMLGIGSGVHLRRCCAVRFGLAGRLRCSTASRAWDWCCWRSPRSFIKLKSAAALTIRTRA